jgi:hypothetical protein
MNGANDISCLGSVAFKMDQVSGLMVVTVAVVVMWLEACQLHWLFAPMY